MKWKDFARDIYGYNEIIPFYKTPVYRCFLRNRIIVTLIGFGLIFCIIRTFYVYYRSELERFILLQQHKEKK